MQAIVSSLGGSRAAFRGVFIVYGAYCSLWIPLSLWVIPKKSLQLGQVRRRTSAEPHSRFTSHNLHASQSSPDVIAGPQRYKRALR